MAEVKYSEDGKTLLRVRDINGHFIIPNSVTEIGDQAFCGCPLQELHIRVLDPEQMEVNKNAFGEFLSKKNSLSDCTLYVPSGTRYAYRHHPVFGKCKDFIIEK